MTLPESITVFDEIERLERELSHARAQLRIATQQRDEAVDALRTIHNAVQDARLMLTKAAL